MVMKLTYECTRKTSVNVICTLKQETLWTSENVIEIHCNISEGIVIFQFILNHFRQSSFSFEQEHVLPGLKNYSPTSTATWTRRSAVSGYGRNYVVAGFASVTKQIVIICCEERTARWTPQRYLSNFDGLVAPKFSVVQH
jgi:hypothetical protein